MTNPALIGSVVIQNNTNETYFVEELGDYELLTGDTVDLLDDELPNYYRDWDSANRLVSSLPTAKLYQDIQSGDIEVMANTPGG